MLIICYFQVADLAKIVEEFTSLCEKICGKQSANLKAAFKIQAGNYVQKFHHQRKSKLAMLLDAERYFYIIFLNFRFSQLLIVLHFGCLLLFICLKSK